MKSQANSLIETLAPLHIHSFLLNINMKTEESTEVVILEGRDALPSHYLFKIKSFSLLKAAVEIYKTSQFEAGGYKWRLHIYPNGDISKNEENYISIYLELMETSSLPVGWEVNVIFNFLIYNQLEDKYDNFQDGRVRRYHAMKTKWGITKCIDLKSFHDPFKGYLIDDTCVFGAEVFVVKCVSKGECLSMIKEPATCYHLWKINKFSNLLEETYESKPFGDYNWKILLYPNGCREATGNSISIFLSLPKSSIPDDTTKLFVRYILRVIDQFEGRHIEFEREQLFAPPQALGPRKFLSLHKLKDPEQGLLVDDACIIEAEVTVLGLIGTE